MRTPRLALAFALAIICLAVCRTPAFAQAAHQAVVILRLTDGSELYGAIVSEAPDQIVLRTLAGAEITVRRDRIRKTTENQGAVLNGEFWREDRLGSKLFLGPTGRALQKGDGYFAIDALFVPTFQVGVTDRLSFGIGKPFYFFTSAYWVTPKYQIYRGERASVATGVLNLHIPGWGIGGVAYTVATVGSPNGAVTVGGGWLYGRDTKDHEGGGTPVVMIGGDRRMTRRSVFVTENYIFHGVVVSTVGGRFIGRTTDFEVGGILAFAGDATAPPGAFFNVIWHSSK